MKEKREEETRVVARCHKKRIVVKSVVMTYHPLATTISLNIWTMNHP